MLRTGARSISCLEMRVTCLAARFSGKPTLEAVTTTSSSSVGGMVSIDLSAAIFSAGPAIAAWALISVQPDSTPMVTVLCKLLKTL